MRSPSDSPIVAPFTQHESRAGRKVILSQRFLLQLLQHTLLRKCPQAGHPPADAGAAFAPDARQGEAPKCELNNC